MSTFKPTPGAKLAMIDLGKCPCGKLIGANFEVGAVSHQEPQCAVFKRSSALEFLKYIRAARGCICTGEKHELYCPLRELLS